MESKWNCACGNANRSKACRKQSAAFLSNETYLSQELAVPGLRLPAREAKAWKGYLIHESPELETTYLSINR